MELSTERTNSRLPTGFFSLPCHAANRDLDLSTIFICYNIFFQKVGIIFFYWAGSRIIFPFVVFLWPCLVHLKNQKLFKITYHIEYATHS